MPTSHGDPVRERARWHPHPEELGESALWLSLAPAVPVVPGVPVVSVAPEAPVIPVVPDVPIVPVVPAVPVAVPVVPTLVFEVPPVVDDPGPAPSTTPP